MARKPLYSLPKGCVRTPEEHRKVLEEIDKAQHDSTYNGIRVSKDRIRNTFGKSQSAFRKKSAPKNKKGPRNYELDRYCSDDNKIHTNRIR